MYIICLPFAIKYHIYPNIRLLWSKMTSSNKTHLPREECINPNLRRHQKKKHLLRKLFYCQFHTQKMSDSIYFDHLVLISYLILQYIIFIAFNI